MAGRHDVLACAGPEDLPVDLHAVTIAAPTVDHARIATDCLDRGWHVLVEKPMTATIAEAEALVEAARRRGLCLAVGHTERFNPVVRSLLERVRRPRFIEGHRLGVFSARSTDVDVVLDLMIHDLDLVQALVRRPLAAVDAIGVRALTDQVDIANARLTFEGGCVANLTASRISAEKVRKIRLFEDDAYLSVDCAKQEGWRYTVRTTLEGAPGIAREPLPAEVEEPLLAELRAFAARARGEEATIVSGSEGVLALRAAHRVLERIRAASAS